jgi:hypothetical protein
MNGSTVRRISSITEVTVLELGDTMFKTRPWPEWILSASLSRPYPAIG